MSCGVQNTFYGGSEQEYKNPVISMISSNSSSKRSGDNVLIIYINAIYQPVTLELFCKCLVEAESYYGQSDVILLIVSMAEQSSATLT